MDLIKLHKQLLRDFIAATPERNHHSVQIQIKIGNHSSQDISIYGWSLRPGDTGDSSDDLQAYVVSQRSLKEAIASFYRQLHKVDNKLELEEGE